MSPSEMCNLFERISEEDMRAITARCRREGVRITSLLMAAFAMGLGPCLMENVTRAARAFGLQRCVDVRRYMPEESKGWLGNLYSMPTLRVPAPAEDAVPRPSISELASMIQDELDAYLAGRDFLRTVAEDAATLVAAAEGLCAAVSNDGYHGRDYYSGLSNLGVLDVNAQAGRVRATEYWFCTRMARVGTFAFLNAASMPGRGMCLMLVYPHPVCSYETARGICKRTMGALWGYARF